MRAGPALIATGGGLATFFLLARRAQAANTENDETGITVDPTSRRPIGSWIAHRLVRRNEGTRSALHVASSFVKEEA